MRIRTHLLLMALAVALPVAIAATVAVHTIVAQERESALRALRENVRATALVVDREVEASIATLTALAASPALEAGDLRAFYVQAATVDGRPDRWIILVDAAEGRQVLNTLRPYGAEMPPSQPWVGSLARQVLQSGRPQATDVARGPLTGKMLTTVMVPVPPDVPKRYVLVQPFDLDHWKKTVLRENVPLEWIVTVLDRNGIVVARSHDGDAYVTRPGGADLVEAARRNMSGLLRRRLREGTDVYHAFTHSSLTGWTVAVAAPAELVEAPARQALYLGVAGVLLTAITTMLAVALFGRRFSRELAQARDAARELGRGREPVLAPSRVRELSEVKFAIRDAAGLLQQEREQRAIADAALVQSEQRLSGFLQSARDAVIVADQDLHIVLFNAAAERIFEQESSELLGRSVSRLLAPDSWTRVQDGIAQERRDGVLPPPRPEPFTGRRRNGETFPMDCAVSVMSDATGANFYIVILRDITQQVRDRQALVQANRELQRVSEEFQQAVLTEVERHQARLARELHDSVASSIAGIALLLGGVKPLVSDARAGQLVAKAQEQIEQVAEAVRQISRGMMPAGGEPGALLQALEQFSRELTDLRHVGCSVRSRGDFSAIQAEVATHLYRIVQEAANNAIRHGGATRLRILLVEHAGDYCLTILDNGRGCDVDALPTAYPGIGLRSMHARAGAIHGTLEVRRHRPEGGCRVRVRWTQQVLRDAETGDTVW